MWVNLSVFMCRVDLQYMFDIIPPMYFADAAPSLLYFTNSRMDKGNISVEINLICLYKQMFLNISLQVWFVILASYISHLVHFLLVKGLDCRQARC